MIANTQTWKPNLNDVIIIELRSWTDMYDSGS